MRFSRLSAVFALGTALFTTGCGGGGSSSAPAVNGTWTGSFLQSATGGKTAVQVAFVQKGSAITGTALTTTSGISSIGTISGTISGSKITATITPESGAYATTSGSTAVLRTDQLRGFGTASWYNTEAPIDLSKPIVVQVGAQVLTPAPAGIALTALTPSQYLVDTTSLYANRVYIAALVPTTTLVQIQYYPYTSVVGTAEFLSGTVSGAGITGVYTLPTSGSNATAGTFTLTKTNSVTTPTVPVSPTLWGGSYTIGGKTTALTLQFTQTGNTLTFTGTVAANGDSNVPLVTSGVGAIIGNNVTLFDNGSPEALRLTGTYALSAAQIPTISGTATDDTGATGTFTITAGVVAAQSRTSK